MILIFAVDCWLSMSQHQLFILFIITYLSLSTIVHLPIYNSETETHIIPVLIMAYSKSDVWKLKVEDLKSALEDLGLNTILFLFYFFGSLFVQ